MTLTDARNGQSKSATDATHARARSFPGFSGRAEATQGARASGRRWGRIVAGVVAVVLGAWIFAAVYLSANDRTAVLVMAQPVARSATISRADLRVVEVGASGGVASVPADDLQKVVGRVAATDLPAGSLLAAASVGSSATKVVGRDQAVVGVLVGRSDAPSSELRAGARVSVVIRGASGSEDAPQVISGRVLDASGDALSDGTRPIELVVARDDAPAVAAAAADKRVSIAVLGG